MEKLVICQGFCPPGIVTHTNESIRNIPHGQYTVTGISLGPDGEKLLTLQQGETSYLVDEAFLEWESNASFSC